LNFVNTNSCDDNLGAAINITMTTTTMLTN